MTVIASVMLHPLAIPGRFSAGSEANPPRALPCRADDKADSDGVPVRLVRPTLAPSGARAVT